MREIAACFSSFLHASGADPFYSFGFAALSEVCFLCVLLLVVKLRFYNDVLCNSRVVMASVGEAVIVLDECVSLVNVRGY